MSVFARSTVFDDDAVLEQNLNNELDSDISELVESFYFDDISRLPAEQIREFVEGGEGQSLVEAGIMSKRTLVRLSKVDDLERRIHQAALQMAKKNNDPLYDQLAKNRVKEKELLTKIKTKYDSRATKTARLAQKQYLKTAPNVFSRMGASLIPGK